MSESTPEPVAPDGNVFVPETDPVVESAIVLETAVVHVPTYNHETGAFE